MITSVFDIGSYPFRGSRICSHEIAWDQLFMLASAQLRMIDLAHGAGWGCRWSTGCGNIMCWIRGFSAGRLACGILRIQADKTPLYRKLEQHIGALTLCVGKLDPSKAYMCSAGRGGNMDQTQARTHTQLVPWQLLLFPLAGCDSITRSV